MDLRTQYTDLYLADALPALRKLTKDRFNLYPDQYPNVFNVMDSDRGIEQDTSVTGFGTFGRTPEGQPVDYDSIAQGYAKTWQHEDFSKGFRVSHQMVRDDKWNLVKGMATALGRAARVSIETEAASDYNNGFSSSFLGPDAVALFSTAHPNVGGGTQSNRPTTAVDFDIPALEAALTAFRKITDDRGLLTMVPPQKLIGPPDLEWRMAEVLSGTQRSDTANNTINAFRQRSEYASFTQWTVYDYLTDADAWFVSGPTSDLKLILWWREKFHILNDMDFDTRSMKSAGWFALSHGWSDWRGLYGSPGA